jgi:hypothetical protein
MTMLISGKPEINAPMEIDALRLKSPRGATKMPRSDANRLRGWRSGGMARTSGAHSRCCACCAHARTVPPRRVARAAAVVAAVLLAGSAAAQTAASAPAAAAPASHPAAEAMPATQLDFSLLDDAAPDVPIKSAPIAPPSSLVSPATVGSRREKVDGSVMLSAGERLATPWDANWDAKVGVDLATPAGAPLPGGAGEDHGAGWADVAVPAAPIGLDKATIDARIDPGADQGKLSTALTRSVPIGDLSLTLQNGYSVTQSLADPNGMPAPASARVFAGDGGVKLEFPSATALTAGARMSSTDERLTPSLSAEQKLFDTPLSITGTISELPTGGTDRSIMAGFKRSW